MESSETKLKGKVLAMLKKDFPEAWVYKTADRWKSGIPDVLICRKGHLFAAELKIGNRKGRKFKLQLHVLEQIKRAGGRAAVCRSVDQVRDLLNEEGGGSDGQGR